MNLMATSIQDNSSAMLLIASYNILAGPLCDTKCFAPPAYNEPELLKFDNRYPRLLEKMQPFVDANAVICLQEVDIEASNRLQLHFERHNYMFLYHSYGWIGNGYMGVALAVPRSLTVKSIDRFKLVDGKPWPKLPVKSFYGAHWLKSASWGWLDYTEKDYSAWKNASKRENFMITVEIEHQDSSVFVSCLHMPCDFKNPFCMHTYAALAKEHLQKIAGDKPHVLAGDFNSKPGDDSYNILTGVVSHVSINQNYPPEDTWRPVVGRPLHSALKRKHGREPSHTISTQTTYSNTYFQDTLDYILVSEGVNVPNSFIAFSNPEATYYPNHDEPSDHLLIWAELTFPDVKAVKASSIETSPVSEPAAMSL